jgi:hypothetical protein
VVNPISSCYQISRSWASSIDNIETKADPEGLGKKKLQELDPIQLEGGPKGVHADIGSLKKVQKYEHLGELKSFLHFDRLSVTIKPVHWERKSVCF